MATPTRPAVLLQSRKSAAAGRVDEARMSTTRVLRTTAAAVILGKIASLMSRSDSPSPRWGVNDDSAEIIDVSERRTRRVQVADAVEKPRGIVVGEKGGGIEAGGERPLYCRTIDKGAGRVVRQALAAIGSVGVAGHGCNPLDAIEIDGKRERIFLIGPPAPPPGLPERDGEFAAREDDDASALRRIVAGELGMNGGNLAGFALELVAEDDAVVAGQTGRGLRGSERVGRSGENAIVGSGKSQVGGLRRFVGGVIERACHCLRQF